MTAGEGRCPPATERKGVISGHMGEGEGRGGVISDSVDGRRMMGRRAACVGGGPRRRDGRQKLVVEIEMVDGSFNSGPSMDKSIFFNSGPSTLDGQTECRAQPTSLKPTSTLFSSCFMCCWNKTSGP